LSAACLKYLRRAIRSHGLTIAGGVGKMTKLAAGVCSIFTRSAVSVDVSPALAGFGKRCRRPRRPLIQRITAANTAAEAFRTRGGGKT